jgi:hypothetical protein
MLRSILLTGLCFGCLFSIAQKTKWYSRAGSGLFFFSGKSAVKEQGLILVSNDRAYNPASYGKTPGFSITVGGSVKKMIHNNWLWEAALDFQSFSSRSTINNVTILPSSLFSLSVGEPATGTFTYRANFISFAPSFGKKIGKGKTSIDITAGPELAVMLGGEAKTGYRSANAGGNFKQDMDAYTRDIDFRIQLQAMLNINKIGIFAGYTKGLSNYAMQQGSEVFTNFIRFGLAYQLK